MFTFISFIFWIFVFFGKSPQQNKVSFIFVVSFFILSTFFWYHKISKALNSALNKPINAFFPKPVYVSCLSGNKIKKERSFSTLTEILREPTLGPNIRYVKVRQLSPADKIKLMEIKGAVVS